MSLLHTIVAFIVALGLLIVVHEFGHYLVARLCGVKVLRFSVGFGRPLLARARLGADRTEWVIAAIPFGGYVKMLDEREGAGRAARAAARLQPPERLAALRHRASPGRSPTSCSRSRSTGRSSCTGCRRRGRSSAAPAAGTVAAQRGLRAGDTVAPVEGEPIATWQELRWRVLQSRCSASTRASRSPTERGAIALAHARPVAASPPTTWRPIS